MNQLHQSGRYSSTIQNIASNANQSWKNHNIDILLFTTSFITSEGRKNYDFNCSLHSSRSFSRECSGQLKEGVIKCSFENVCRLLCDICDWAPDSLITGNSALLRALASSLSFHILPSWRIDGSGGGHLTGWSLSGGSRGCSTGLNSSAGSTPWLSAKMAGESLPDGVPSLSSDEAWDRRPALDDDKRENIPTIPTHQRTWEAEDEILDTHFSTF